MKATLAVPLVAACIPLLASLALVGLALADPDPDPADPAAPRPAAAGRLQGPIAVLEPLLGTWEMEGEWSWGSTVWSRSSYTPGLNGHSVEGRVLVKDGDGPPYQRYRTVFAHDADRDTWVAHTFHRDGSVTATDFRFEDGVMTTEWTEGETTIRDRSALLGDGRMHWTVQTAPAGSEEFQTVMDTTWHQCREGLMPKPIDSNLFVAEERTTSFSIETVIRAPVRSVYRAWTDGEAFAAAYDPEMDALRADIDLAIGGRYEWLWDGKMGSNDCQVLSFLPNRMISFSWNAPPDQPDSRAQRTWVVVELESADDGATRCRLTHLGFGKAAHWQETREYFESAWPYVLGQFRKNLEARAEKQEGTR